MIKHWEEYAELSDLVDTAAERLITASGMSGSHYLLMHVLRQRYGLVAMSREDAIRKARKLLAEFAGRVV